MLPLSGNVAYEIEVLNTFPNHWNTGIFFEQNHQSDHQGPGIPYAHFKNLKCQSNILGNNYLQRRGQANLWVNPA